MSDQAEEITIANYTIPELAEEWEKYVQDYLDETIKFHSEEDEDFAEEIKENGIPAEILNTAEQEAWNVLRTEFGAFGLDSEVEDQIAEIIESKRNA